MTNQLGEYFSSKAVEIRSKFDGVKSIAWKVDTDEEGVTMGVSACISFNDESQYLSAKGLLDSIEWSGKSSRYGRKCLSIELLDFPKKAHWSNVGTLY